MLTQPKHYGKKFIFKIALLIAVYLFDELEPIKSSYDYMLYVCSNTTRIACICDVYVGGRARLTKIKCNSAASKLPLKLRLKKFYKH